MAIDAISAVTVSLLKSALSSQTAKDLFKTIVSRRIAEKARLKATNPNADQELGALEEADLISPVPGGEKYFVTAKGLKIARDLEKISD